MYYKFILRYLFVIIINVHYVTSLYTIFRIVFLLRELNGRKKIPRL